MKFKVDLHDAPDVEQVIAESHIADHGISALIAGKDRDSIAGHRSGPAE